MHRITHLVPRYPQHEPLTNVACLVADLFKGVASSPKRLLVLVHQLGTVTTLHLPGVLDAIHSLFMIRDILVLRPKSFVYGTTRAGQDNQ